MHAKDIIFDDMIPLKKSDTGLDALNWMDENRVSQLPVVEDLNYFGLLSDLDIYHLNAPEKPINEQKISLSRIFCFSDQHILEVIKQFALQKLTLLPVLDRKNKYLGVITLKTLIEKYAQLSAIQNPGGIIVLELNSNDYSLLEITQIIESNDAKIISMYINTFKDSTKLNVTIKVNRIDIQAILQTFNRYNYIIKATYSEDFDYQDELLKRYDSLMNYLNM